MLVSVIILNWNNIDIICDCISSVLKQDYAPLELFVIDNNSGDGSREKIRSEFPEIKLIENSTNLGFCKANNNVISRSKGEFVLLLNADVIIEQDYVKEMVKAAQSSEKIGSAAGKLLKLDPDNRKTDIIDSTGHLLTKSFCPFNRGQREKDRGQYNVQENVFGTTGAAALYRKKMLEDTKINGEYFDELFFAFYEDTDLDWRAQLFGWRCVFTPKAVAYHYRGGSVKGADRKWIHKHYFKNRYMMVFKNATLDLMLRNMHHIILFEIASFIELILAPYLMFSIFTFLKYLPQILIKRGIIQKRRRVASKEIGKFLVCIEFKKRFRNRLNSYRQMIFSKG